MTLASNQPLPSRRKGRRLCGAKTQASGCCRIQSRAGQSALPLPWSGKSTGPKTQAGRARIAEAQRLRWRAYRERVRAVRSDDEAGSKS
jgi:hypothetical protein